MPRYKLTIEYHGGPYCGWQRQDDRPSVQEALMEAVEKFSGQRSDVVGAGRTDSGVHATGQVAHIDLPKRSDPYKIMQGINFHLFDVPEGEESKNRISVLKVEEVADDFSARFSATRRHYLYRITNRRSRLGLEVGRTWLVVEPLDVDALQAAANVLVGHHNFSSFRDTQCQAKSPEKTLEQFDVSRVGDEIHCVLSARSFLHHQVRIMVGTLSLVGKGRWSVDDVKKALDARDRTKAGLTAPAEGLYLTQVDY